MSVSKVVAPSSFPALPRSDFFFVDKNSWLSLSKSSGGAAQWRAATCKIAEEEGGCQLNVYVEVRRFSGPVKPRRGEI